MTRKEHRKICRKIIDILTKKFIDVSIETCRYFEDKTEFESVDLFFYFDSYKLKLNDIKNSMGDIKQVKEILVDIDNKLTITLDIEEKTDIICNINFYNSIDTYKFNILINSFYPFKSIMTILLKSYDCDITEIGLTKNINNVDKLITNDFDLFMETIGIDINTFQKSFTKEQFFKFLLTVQSMCTAPFFNMNDNELDGFVKYLKEHSANIQFRTNYHIIRKIDLLLDPKEVCKRTIDKMEFNKKDIYEELMFLYVNRDKELSFKNIDRKIFFYINNLLEAFYLSNHETNGVLNFEGSEISIYNKKVSKINVFPYLFKISYNSKELIYGFDLSYSALFNKLKFNIVISNNKDNELNIIANKFSTYLIDKFKFSFTFILNNIDIRANMNERLDELKDLKVKK